jgi:hypothetical protein
MNYHIELESEIRNNTGYLGRVPVVSYRYDGMRSRDDTHYYIVEGLFPKLKKVIGKTEAEEQAIALCELAIKQAIKMLENK